MPVLSVPVSHHRRKYVPIPNDHAEDTSPVSLSYYARKDLQWVNQAVAAGNGALAASKARLKYHLNSLDPQSDDAEAIRTFLELGV